jgi:hypothetical protein
MEILRENKIRVAYSIISAILVWLAYKYNSEIVENSEKFNEFGYIGGVATLIGLLIAVSEVIHSVRISKGIQKEAAALVSHARTIDLTSFISECLSTLDETNDHVSGERYLIALKCFQHFRRTYLRVPITDEISKITATVQEIEISLHSSTHASAKSPLTKKQRLNIQEKIMEIKSVLEKITPIAGGTHVS